MTFDELAAYLDGIPHMTRQQGERIHQLITDTGVQSILELGTAHGVGAAFMAHAIQENGGGQIITIDRKEARDHERNVIEIANELGFSEIIKPLFADSSYNWELRKLIRENTKDGVSEPIFDFCYMDGAHDFEIDAAAFVLADQLLKPGGLMLFDDVTWTYGRSATLKNTEKVKNMSEDERTLPHVKEIIELLVLTNPNYENFSFEEDWFLAQKKDGSTHSNRSISLNNYEVKTSLMDDIKKLVKRLIR